MSWTYQFKFLIIHSLPLPSLFSFSFSIQLLLRKITIITFIKITAFIFFIVNVWGADEGKIRLLYLLGFWKTWRWGSFKGWNYIWYKVLVDLLISSIIIYFEYFTFNRLGILSDFNFRWLYLIINFWQWNSHRFCVFFPFSFQVSKNLFSFNHSFFVKFFEKILSFLRYHWIDFI